MRLERWSMGRGESGRVDRAEVGVGLMPEPLGKVRMTLHRRAEEARERVGEAGGAGRHA